MKGLRSVAAEARALEQRLAQSFSPTAATEQLLAGLAGALGRSGRADPDDAAVRTAGGGPAGTPAVAAWAARASAAVTAAGLTDPLGWLYLTLRGRRRRRSLGAFYTPAAVAEYLCRQALSGLPPGARVLDPACGSGAFLMAAHGVTGGTARLEGWETDAVAAAVARQRLGLAGATARVLHRDALACDGGPAYDAVLGNPPYLGSGLRGLANWPADRRAELMARFPAAEYKLNLYGLFVEQGLRLLRPGGRLAFVLPDSLLLGRYFARLRRALLDQARIRELALVMPSLWPDGEVGRSLLLIAERGPAGPDHRVAVRRVENLAELAGDQPGTGLRQPEGASAEPRVFQQPQADWAAAPPWRFRLFFRAADRDLVRRLAAHPRAVPLGRVLRTYSGLIGRAGQQSLLRSSYPAGGVRVDRDGRTLYQGRPAPDAWEPLLRSGAEIDRYRVAWRGEQVLLEPALIKSGGKAALYRGPKLLLRQTADCLRAAYDDTGLFCLNNIHLLARRDPADRHDLRYWLTLINSRLLGGYYRLTALEEGRVYPQVDLDMLAGLPLCAIDFALPADRAAHDRLVALAVEREQAAAGAQAGAVEDAIEHLVRQLYGEQSP